MSVVQACPRCGAAVPRDGSWCSLCFEPLDRFDPLTAPLEQLEERPEPPAAGADVEPGPPTQVVVPAPSEVAAPSEPDLATGHDTDLDLDTMFLLLAAEHRSQDPLSTVADRMEDRSTRVLVIGGGMVGLSLVLVGVLALLSLLG